MENRFFLTFFVVFSFPTRASIFKGAKIFETSFFPLPKQLEIMNFNLRDRRYLQPAWKIGEIPALDDFVPINNTDLPPRPLSPLPPSPFTRQFVVPPPSLPIRYDFQNRAYIDLTIPDLE